MKCAKKSKKIVLSFCSCQCNFSISRTKTTEPHNSWCHSYELTAFPEVGILVSENKLFIQTRQTSSSQVPCNSLPQSWTLSLPSPLSFDGQNHAPNLRIVMLLVVSFLLFIFLNIVNIYFKYFSTWIYFF